MSRVKPFKSDNTPRYDLEESSRFVSATENDNYTIWLTQADIANIARYVYGWHGEEGSVIFEVIGSVDQLGIQLERHKNKLAAPNRQSLTFVVNLGDNHWVTLVVACKVLLFSAFRQPQCSAYQGLYVPYHAGEQYSAYYIDSLNRGIPDDIRSRLEEEIPGIDIQSFNIKQQNDGCNCGIFALENARLINDKLNNGREEQIEERLQLYRPTRWQLQSKRREFASHLIRSDTNHRLRGNAGGGDGGDGGEEGDDEE